MLVSRNVFPVVSALQSIAFIHIFLADQISCRSYGGNVYRMRSLAVYSQVTKPATVKWSVGNKFVFFFQFILITGSRSSHYMYHSHV